MPPLRDEMSEALERGVSIRNMYFEGDPISHLRSGASDRDIEALEKLIGGKLSPTYRQFFLLSDGWENVSATIPLMSCREIVQARTTGQFEYWFEEFWDSDFGPRENALVF